MKNAALLTNDDELQINALETQLSAQTLAQVLATEATAVSPKNVTIEPKLAQLLEFTQTNSTSVTPKDINANLAQVLQSYDELTALYAQNSQRIDADLTALRQAGGAVSSQLHQLDAALHQQNSVLGALESQAVNSVQSIGSLDVRVGSLDASVVSLDGLLAQQSDIIQEQTLRLDQFNVAQELLDTATRGNRNRIENARQFSAQQHAIVQAQVEGLRALSREHYAEFESVKDLVTVLRTEARRLDQSIQNVSEGLQTHVADTKTRFKWTHGAVLAVLLTSLSGFALVKWATAFAPASTERAVAQLNQDVGAIGTQLAELSAVKGIAEQQDAKVGLVSNKVVQLEKNMQALRETVQRQLILNKPVPSVLPGDAGALSVQDSQWLLQQNAKSYTVQLLGVPTQDEMTAFLAAHGAPLNDRGLAYALTQRDQRDRYNLFYGVFDDADQARAAIDALPLEVRANKPWVRQLQSVQKVLR